MCSFCIATYHYLQLVSYKSFLYQKITELYLIEFPTFKSIKMTDQNANNRIKINKFKFELNIDFFELM